MRDRIDFENVAHVLGANEAKAISYFLFPNYLSEGLVPHLAYYDGSDQRSAPPDNSATPQMYRSGTFREMSELPGTAASSSSSRHSRRDGGLA